MYRSYIKRLLDIFLSVVLIIVLLFFMITVSVIIKLDSPGTVLFKQKRVGKDRKTFTILKFRSMPMSKQKGNNSVALSKFQLFLRKSSIDELPQLFNILAGDMSFVGPRPVIEAQSDLVEEREKYGANAIRPGLTGWAQVNGREKISMTEKAYFDGEYTRILNSSGLGGFLIDIKCFFKTFFVIFENE